MLPRRKRYRPPHRRPGLADVLRGIAWPFGERREVAFWVSVARYAPLLLCPLAGVLALSSVSPEALDVLLPSAGGTGKDVGEHVCGRAISKWSECDGIQGALLLASAWTALLAVLAWGVGGVREPS